MNLYFNKKSLFVNLLFSLSFLISAIPAMGDGELPPQHQCTGTESGGVCGTGNSIVNGVGSAFSGIRDGVKGLFKDGAGTPGAGGASDAAGAADTGGGSALANCGPNATQLETYGQNLIKFCKTALTSCEGSSIGGALILELTTEVSGGTNSARTTANDFKDLVDKGNLAETSVLKVCSTNRDICNKNLPIFQKETKITLSNIPVDLQISCNPQITNYSANIVTKAIKLKNQIDQKIAASLQGVAQGIANGLSADDIIKKLQGNDGNGVTNFLKENKDLLIGGAVGLGAGYLLFGGDDKGGGGGGSSGASAGNYNVEENPDGGQCLNYGQGQKQCYTNEDLSRLCAASNNTSTPTTAYPYPGLAQQQNQTNAMKEAVCTAYKEDTREGGGGDENTCQTHNAEYYKTKACETRLIAQCQNTDYGDCANFNSHYCYGSEETKGNNYCMYREAKDYCENRGGAATSPSCAWLRQMASLGANGGTSCSANIFQADCYPNNFRNQTEMEQTCARMAISQSDPLCKNINNSNLYFSWRNPGSPGGTTVGGGNNSGGSAGNSGELETADNCSQPAMDCALPENRSNGQCVQYYCCMQKNKAAPICQGLSFSTASAGANQSYMNALQNRYPAGSLPSDISSNRNSSIFTSSKSNTANTLCQRAELYDCGSLSGYIPKVK
ncbi:MAG: hypothetical protein KDD58_06120 [Bdellovibrionales bacterium]|nr:hypothetical protein [Bdellovibrionales bacterium]